jgi:NTE family protein
VAFNAVLIKELRAFALIKDVVDPGSGEGALLAKMHLHRISSDVLLELGYSSKMLAEWEFFCMLRDTGRAAADAFLAQHSDDLGRRSTLDLTPYREGI